MTPLHWFIIGFAVFSIGFVTWFFVIMSNTDKEYRELLKENKAIEDLFFFNLRRHK